MEDRLDWPDIGALMLSVGVLAFALTLLRSGSFDIGFSLAAVLASALLWWFASIAAVLPSRFCKNAGNLLNAVAASFAALAGVLAVDHGGQAMVRAFQSMPPAGIPHQSPLDRQPRSRSTLL